MKKYHSITGMHCRSCELIIEQHISAIPDVTGVKVNHRTGVATVQYRDGANIDDALVSKAVRNAGYTLGDQERQPWITRDPADWHEFIVALCVLFILALVYKILGLDLLASRMTAAAGPTSALLIGLVAGVSTCMALVGGLVLGISSRHAQRNPSATPWQRFQPHIAFNGGRLVSFAVLGGAIGSIGSALQLKGSLLGAIIIVAGFAMVLMGIKLTGLLPRIQNIALPSSIARWLGLGRTESRYSHTRTATMGALTFFVPCGFTQAMQIYAMSTGSFVSGAVVMTAFALGTLPGLLGVGGLSSLARGAAGRMFFRVAGVAVLLLGLWNVSNGWNLTGIILRASQTTPGQAVNARTAVAQIREGVQYVDMTQDTFGYSLDRIMVKRGIPVVWNITSTNAYTCASSLMVPALNIATRLVPGENTLTFTPTKRGLMRFSCSMGMYGGIIEVTN